MISEVLRSFTHCRSSACIRQGNLDVSPPTPRKPPAPLFPILSAVCRAPGQDSGLGRWDREYLYSQDGSFHFLELNPRLQWNIPARR